MAGQVDWIKRERLSIVVRRDSSSDCFEIAVIRDGKVLPVENEKLGFIIRVAVTEDGSPNRCLIRHIASGREVYLQSGADLSAFIEECLLSRVEPERLDP